MVNLTKALCLTILLYSCVEDPEELPEVNEFRTAEEELLTQTWQYEEIEAADSRYNLASSKMELGSDRNALGGNRADISKRRIVYYSNGTYQLKWIERGDYSLGTEGDPNWQPNFGTWELTENTLTHNKGFYYETAYTIALSESNLLRTSTRFMSEQLIGARWESGEYVQQTEIFTTVN